MSPNQKKAYIYALTAVLLWSTVASAFKLSLEYLAPAQLLLFATIVSALALAGVITYQKRWHELKAFPKKAVLQSIFLGFINPFVYYLVLFEAYSLLPAQEAQPLNYTWALMLTCLSVPILGHRLGVNDFVAGLVCYSGVLVISTQGDLPGMQFSEPTGVAFALGSTILWALYWIYSTKWKQEPVLGLFINFASGIVPIFIYTRMTVGIGDLNLYGLLGATYVGLFEMGITFLFWMYALRLTESAAKIANLIFLSPFLSLIFISFLVGETIRESTLIGLVLIIGGLCIQKYWRKNPENQL